MQPQHRPVRLRQVARQGKTEIVGARVLPHQVDCVGPRTDREHITGRDAAVRKAKSVTKIYSTNLYIRHRQLSGPDLVPAREVRRGARSARHGIRHGSQRGARRAVDPDSHDTGRRMTPISGRSTALLQYKIIDAPAWGTTRILTGRVQYVQNEPRTPAEREADKVHRVCVQIRKGGRSKPLDVSAAIDRQVARIGQRRQDGSRSLAAGRTPQRHPQVGRIAPRWPHTCKIDFNRLQGVATRVVARPEPLGNFQRTYLR